MNSNKEKFNKIRLRLYKESDLEFLHGLLSDEVTKEYFPFMYTIDKEQTLLRMKMRLQDYEFGINTRFVIEDMKTRKPVGEISGRVAKADSSCMELAILVHPHFRGQGFAKDGILKFIEKMREIKPDITKFRMKIAESNLASQAVAKKLEFKLKSEKEDGSVNKTKMQCWEDK